MPKAELVESRLQLARSPEDKKPLLVRLTRIEGQVRGLRNMIEDDRYCLDEVQQINAITAALREVALLIIGDHVSEGVKVAVGSQDAQATVDDLMRVLRTAMRLRD